MNNLINTQRYPIGRLDTDAGRDLLRECHEKLAEDGALALPDFVMPAALTSILAELDRDTIQSHRMEGFFTPYSDNLSEADDTSLPDDHPRRHRLPASHRFIAGDAFAAQSALRQIYEDETLIEFIRAVLDIPALYTIDDPLGCVNALVYEPGDCNGWHFDTTDFIVSIALQNPRQGGDYQYIPSLRSPEDENFAGVTARMRDPDNPHGVQSVELPAGCLFLFKGKYTLHRVTEVQGDVSRMVAILSYDLAPNHMLSEGSKMAMYGRIEG